MNGLIILIVAVILSAIYVWYVHSTMKKEFTENEWIEAEEQETESDIF